MSARRFAILATLALIVMFAAVNVLMSTFARGIRLDLTANQLYSLNPGTRSLLSDMAEPIELTFYYSREAGARYPAVRAYAARVEELLRSYAGASRGKVRLRIVDPVRFSEDEDAAIAARIQPLTIEPGGEPIYFGLSGANAVDERVAIPAFDLRREPFLEYEVSRLVSELDAPRQLRIGLITALDVQIGDGGSAVFAEMNRLGEVRRIEPGFASVPDEIDVLALIHPPPLQPQESAAVAAFLSRKGRAFIAVDPAAVLAGQSQAAMFGPPPQSASDVNALLQPFGVSVSADVVMDGEHAQPVQAGAPPLPLFFALPAERLSREDLVTAGMARGLTILAPGAISWSKVDGVVVTPLARTGAVTMRLSAAEALAFPQAEQLLASFVPANRAEAIAVRISGRPASAQQPVEIVLISDTDFLDDRLFFDPNAGPAFDNAAFALNAIDVLSGAPELTALRSRAPSLNRLTLIDDIRAEAARDVAAAEEKLRAELAETEARLARLQERGGGSGFFAGQLGAELTPGEREEVDRFTARAVELRAELRAVERALRARLERLEGWIVALNVWLAPLLAAGIGLYLFWRRQRRGGQQRPKEES
jgi:ABC-type uncharacterized transport system involved in gliding motility auxiliary subunit